MKSTSIETPMLDKIHNIKEDSQKIGEFLYWLTENGIVLCATPEKPFPGEEYAPIGEPIETILARYFEIDLAKAEEERVAILDQMRRHGA